MSLTDYEAIQNLKAHYCRAADSSPQDRAGAHVALRALFADDVTADYGMGALAGADEIATFLSDAIAGGSAWMVHNIHSPLIEISGDEATGHWTVNVRMKRAETGNLDFVFGRYEDRFRREGGEWRIADIRFDRFE